MNSLVMKTNEFLFNKRVVGIRIPYTIAYLFGKILDLISKATDKKLPISSIRVKKFCSETSFVSEEAVAINFNRPFCLDEGIRRTLEYEFLSDNSGNKTFYAE